MSRVMCVSCGNSVVVDPQGRCPEGHEVGVAGARVEQAMGADGPHPDEPEPWVYRIDDDDAVGVEATGGSTAAAAGNGHRTAARIARPLGLPGTDPEEPVDSDALLRELHALGDLAVDGGSGPLHAEEPAPPEPPAELPNEPSWLDPPEDETSGDTAGSIAGDAAGDPVVPAPRPDRDMLTDVFAELSALDAGGFRSNGAAAAPPPAPTPPAPPTHQADGQATDDDLDALFSGFDDTVEVPAGTEAPADFNEPAGTAEGPGSAGGSTTDAVEEPAEELAEGPVSTVAEELSALLGEAAWAADQQTDAPPAPATEATDVAPPVPSEVRGSNHHPDEQPANNAAATDAAATGRPADAGPPAASAKSVDLTSFTAKGSAPAGRKRRRLLGR